MLLLVAVLTRLFVVAALTGSLSTILTGPAAFVIVVSAVLGLVLRSNVSPTPQSAPRGGVHAGRDLADL